MKDWKKRKLTLFGKVTVINSLVISKLAYIANVQPISTIRIKEIEKLIFTFLWNGKKVKRLVINSYENGGLKLQKSYRVWFRTKSNE